MPRASHLFERKTLLHAKRFKAVTRDHNSHEPKNKAAKDKEERVIGPGPTLVRDLYLKQAALNISFNQQPASSSITFIALAFLCVFVFARLLPADATAACSLRAGTSTAPAHIPDVAAACPGVANAGSAFPAARNGGAVARRKEHVLRIGWKVLVLFD